MNRVIRYILFFILMPISLLAQWKIENAGRSGYIHDVKFLDNNFGWIECEFELLITTDTGTSWTSIYTTNYDSDIGDAAFVNATTGYISRRSYSSIIEDELLKTTNGGITWGKKYSGSVSSILALNDTALFIICPGEDVTFRKSLDGGESWDNITPSGLPVYSYIGGAFFLNPNRGFLIISRSSTTLKSWIYRTYNGGATWETGEHSEGLIRDIFFSDGANGFGIIDDSLCISSNSGRSWEKIYEKVYSYNFTESEELFITVNETDDIPNAQPMTGRLLYSSDYGVSWNEEYDKKNMFVNVTVFNNKVYLTEGIYSFMMLGLQSQGTILSVRDRSESGETWESIKISQPMSSVFLVNQETGFIAGTDAPLHTQYGLILSTRNGGVNWGITLSDNIYLTDIVFVNDSVGYYSADASIWGVPEKNGIYKTTSGGKNWTKTIGSEWIQIQDMSVAGDQVVWAGGMRWGEYDREGVIYYSSDGGESWEAEWTELNYTINSIHHINEDYGWAAGTYEESGSPLTGVVFKYDSINGWILLQLASDVWLDKIFFVNENIGFVSGGDWSNENTEFLKTTDGGATWYAPDCPDYRVHDLFIDPYGSGWAVGQTKGMNDLLWKGVILKTDNYGETWSVETDTLQSPLEALSVKDSLAIAVGGRGLIVRTTNKGVSWVDDDGNNVVSNYNLEQNYPNPFNPATVIQYSIPSVAALSSFPSGAEGAVEGHNQNRTGSHQVTLKVYDILGREVATLVNEHRRPGNYQVKWDASNFSSGIYFYKLATGSFSAVKKMLVIK